VDRSAGIVTPVLSAGSRRVFSTGSCTGISVPPSGTRVWRIAGPFRFAESFGTVARHAAARHAEREGAEAALSNSYTIQPEMLIFGHFHVIRCLLHQIRLFLHGISMENRTRITASTPTHCLTAMTMLWM
jgi:hypothetical protein